VIPPVARKLFIYCVLGIVVLVASIAVSAFALHTWGAHRLAVERSSFADAWGVSFEPEPAPAANESNGFGWLAKGAEGITCSAEESRFFGTLADRHPRAWTEEERARARHLLEDQQPALALLYRAGTAAVFDLGHSGGAEVHEEINGMSLIKGFKLLVLDARLAFFDERFADGIAAVTAVGRSADGLMRTPVIRASVIGSGAARWCTWAAADLVGDPCVDRATLSVLLEALPSEYPLVRHSATMAASVSEIADKGLSYLDGPNDPSLAWSVPFWIPNRYVFEDLFLADLITRWRYILELGNTPAINWPSDAGHAIWWDSPWPSWFAMTGVYTPNLLTAFCRAQAAATEIHQLRSTIGLRLSSPNGDGGASCKGFESSGPVPLTGEPLTCRVDEEGAVLIIEAPGATRALDSLAVMDARAGLLAPVEIPIGPRPASCSGS